MKVIILQHLCLFDYFATSYDGKRWENINLLTNKNIFIELIQFLRKTIPLENEVVNQNNNKMKSLTYHQQHRMKKSEKKLEIIQAIWMHQTHLLKTTWFQMFYYEQKDTEVILQPKADVTLQPQSEGEVTFWLQDDGEITLQPLENGEVTI